MVEGKQEKQSSLAQISLMLFEWRLYYVCKSDLWSKRSLEGFKRL